MNVGKAFQISTGVALLVICICNVGCRHAPVCVSTQKDELSWSEFELPRVGKISVVVKGDVKHPGRYYLDPSASLESVYHSFGGWGGNGEFGIAPPRASLTRMVDGRRTDTYYPIKKMTTQEKESVVLKNGDILFYPAVWF